MDGVRDLPDAPPISADHAAPEVLLDAVDANFAVHVAWAAAATDGMRVSEEFGVVLTDSGLDCDTFNVACGARFAEDSAAECVHDALAFYREAGRPFSWWVGPADKPCNLGDLLRAAGFRDLLHIHGLPEDDACAAMTADLSALPNLDLAPAGLDIRRVRDAEGLRDYAAHFGDADVVQYYDLAAPALLSVDSPQRFYVGYLDGLPVATSELTLGGGVAGVYSVSTAAEYRRKGIGTAMTLRPLLDAREGGYGVGVLHAAPGAVGVYARLGFEPRGAVHEFWP